MQTYLPASRGDLDPDQAPAATVRSSVVIATAITLPVGCP
jgi:hypothetical protein